MLHVSKCMETRIIKLIETEMERQVAGLLGSDPRDPCGIAIIKGTYTGLKQARDIVINSQRRDMDE
jgi:hypothetical protein